MTEHLARCESCYEVFAGAVHFQEEESSAVDTGGRGVLPFPLVEGKPQEKHTRVEPARPPRRASRWLPLAASVVLAVGLGYMIWQSSQALPDVTVAGVVEPLQSAPGIVEELYQADVERGAPGEAPFSSAPLFLAGVYLVDLRLSVKAGEVKTTEDILYNVSGALEQVSEVSPEIVTFFKGKGSQIKGPADLDRLAQELPGKESALQNDLAENPFFRFGLWTEASRLSAKTQSPELFELRANRRFLSGIQREISSSGERYAPILSDLQKIEPLWDRDERRPEDYQALAQLFEKIIRRMEQIQKEDQEDFDPLPDN